MLGLLFMLFGEMSFAQIGIYSGATGQSAALEQVIESIPKGSVVFVGERHYTPAHHQNQKSIIEGLQYSGHQVDVGFEFLQKRFQSDLNQYLMHEVTEPEFIEGVEWGQKFELYKPLMWSVYDQGGIVLAINGDRRISGQIAKGGLSSLSVEQMAEIPSHFKLGNDHYYNRFKQAIGGIKADKKLLNYFTAQSFWDDTMAEQIARHKKKFPKRTLVIVVGMFHIDYGGGIPDRLNSYLESPVSTVTIQQLDLIDEENIEAMTEKIVSHPDWGMRANWVWVTDSRGQLQ